MEMGLTKRYQGWIIAKDVAELHMSPTIRIDEEVWEWLKKHARPLEDTPNTVLRRLAGLDEPIDRGEPLSPASERGSSAMSISTIQPTKRRPGGAQMLDRFLHELTSNVSSGDLRVRSWLGGHRRSRNVVELCGKDSSLILYIKTRSDSGGFWGLNTNQLDSLRASTKAWCVLFLIGPRENGYLLSSQEVERAISQKRWSYGQAGDYKIHEGSELAGTRNYNTYADLAAEIIHSELGKTP